MNTIVGSQPYGSITQTSVYTSNKKVFDQLSNATFRKDSSGNVFADYDTGTKDKSGAARMGSMNVRELFQGGAFTYKTDSNIKDVGALLLGGASFNYTGEPDPVTGEVEQPTAPTNLAPAPTTPTTPSTIPSLPAMGGGGGTPNLGTNTSGNSGNSGGSSFTMLPGPAATNPLPSAQDVIKQAQLAAQKLIASVNQQDVGYKTAQDALNNKKRGLLSTIIAGNKTNGNPLVERPSLLGQ